MPEPTFMQRLFREKALSRYLTALERGDIDTIIATLHQSANDATLEQMIFELHETYQTEEEFLAMVQEEQEMDFKEGIHKSLPQEEMDGLQEAEGTPAPKPGRYARWFQVLVAILLVALLSGGVLLYTRLHGTGAQTASSQSPWCTSPGAPLGPTDLPQFNSIAAVAPDDVWIVGQNQLPDQQIPLLEHWNGKTWSVVHDAAPSNQGTYLNDLVALSTNDVWAVGSTYVPTPNTYIYTQQPLVEKWNGQKWQVLSGLSVLGPGSWFGSVSATSDSDIWAIGGIYIPTHDATPTFASQHLIVHWDGNQWSTPQLPAALQNGIVTSVKALAPDDVWITGDTGQTVSQGKPLIAHWDGQSWVLTPLPSKISSLPGNFTNLTAFSVNDVWAAGSSYSGQTQTPIILRWNGSQWTQMATPTVTNRSIYLGNLTATGEHSLWAVGRVYGNGPSQMLVMHWNGQSWSIVLEQNAQAPNGGNKFLSGITVSGPKIWVMGGVYQSGTTTNPFIETNC